MAMDRMILHYYKVRWWLRALAVLVVLHTAPVTHGLHAQGIPYIKNFNFEDYNGHNRNFDIEIDKDGTLFVANFEGLLYYDNAEWRILHTPSITRITVVLCDSKGQVWVGGYNYFGRVKRLPNGELSLQRVGARKQFRGEVLEIAENNGTVFFYVNNGCRYKIVNNMAVLDAKLIDSEVNVGLSDLVNINGFDKKNADIVLQDTLQVEPIDNGMKAVVLKERGVRIIDAAGRELYQLNEANGICSNHISYTVYNGHGTLWGATDYGIFAVAVPSSYSHFTSQNGLFGEVLSIEAFNGSIYVGTNKGLYRQTAQRLEHVPGLNYACWKLQATEKGLLVASANGIFRLSAAGTVSQITTASTTTLLADGDYIYSSELNGVYQMDFNGNNRTRCCDLEKANRMLMDDENTIWVQNLYGEVWSKRTTDRTFKPISIGVVAEKIATIVPVGNKVELVYADDTEPFPYPQFAYEDEQGVTWLTQNDGKGLYRWKDGQRLRDMDALLFPFTDIAVRTMLCEQNKVWIGTNHGLVVIDNGVEDKSLTAKPKLKFRSVVLNGDSVLWGGFGEMPKTLPRLDNDDHNLRFTFSLDSNPIVGKTQYRYRLNKASWSVWSTQSSASFFNLSHGSYTITIQAMLASGVMTEEVSMNFSIEYPFYLRWYMILLYIVLAACLIYAIIRYRLHRLNMEKEKLETIIKERTAEVVKQKDEIEVKSKSLEQALNDLSNAQHEIIRQEKMATVGKLTQGLIDRILNPLNYINNFSKLSEGLVKDIRANIDDDKDNMDNENYEDTVDVLDMLDCNLKKVGEHGENTTRTLKAMEEMLKDRSGGIVPMNLSAVLHQDEAMTQNYFAEDISKYGVSVTFTFPDNELHINGNAEQLSKMVMSMIGNAFYAVVKKAQRDNQQTDATATARQYLPEISLKVYTDHGGPTQSTDKTPHNNEQQSVTIAIRDNGIGIESTILDKVFDPFFTTKTTGEASGVGLYLSREIVQNHGGDISVRSEKNVFTEFIISLPLACQTEQ